MPSSARPALAVLGGLLAALAVGCLASLLVGSAFLDPGSVWHALTGGQGRAATIVWEVRIPRTVAGIVVGVALGAAGAVMQGQTRNPLADPGLFGVTAGASLAVVVAIFAFGAHAPGAQVWFAMVGAAAATGIVLAVAAGARAGTDPVPLALAGVAVSALLGTVISFLVLSNRSTLDTYRRWVVGSLSGRGLGVSLQVLPFVVVGLLLALANARTLDMLGMGDDVARGLGASVLPGRVAGLAAVSLLTAAATAAAGPIAFLGLMAPHLARRLVGIGYRWVVPCSALLGGVLLLAADVVGRLVPGELQVGVGIALAGGPVFLAVVRGRRKALAL
jgi:iron complex transport system permease protein